LYAVKSKKVNENLNIELKATAKAVDLYKLYHDLSIFLSNDVEPSMFVKNVKLFPIYGNPDHLKSITNRTNNAEGYQIIGFLNKKDVVEAANFLINNDLDKLASVQTYFDALDSLVKEELKMLLEDETVPHLHSYLQFLVTFFKECKENKSEVIIIANS
jgi:phosphoketolase